MNDLISQDICPRAMRPVTGSRWKLARSRGSPNVSSWIPHLVAIFFSPMFLNPGWLRRLATIGFLFALRVLAPAAPTVQTIAPAAGSTVNSLTQIAVTFSEAVTGVDANDLLINNDAAVSVSGSGAGPYTFTFTQPQPGSINISWDFDHGIAGIGTGPFQQGTWSYTLIDTVAPTIALISSSVPGQELQAIVPLPGSTVGTLTQTEVTFSEPVAGVDASDLLINGLPASGVTGSGAGPYIFTFAQPNVGTVPCVGRRVQEFMILPQPQTLLPAETGASRGAGADKGIWSSMNSLRPMPRASPTKMASNPAGLKSIIPALPR